MQPLRSEPRLTSHISDDKSVVTFTETDQKGLKNRIIIDMRKIDTSTVEGFKLYGSIYIEAINAELDNSLQRSKEALYESSTRDITPMPKRMNLLERAFKALTRVALIAALFFAVYRLKQSLFG